MKMSKAEEFAEKLTNELGFAWTPKVWSDLGWKDSAVCIGWKYSAICSPLEVFPTPFEESPYKCSIANGLAVVEGDTPAESVRKALKRLMDEQERIEHLVKACEVIVEKLDM